MSAGICIMNKQAIAMAADSAVTIGDHAAIHNSANKLFAISKVASVGMIIYSNASFMQVPMEIIVKQYKKSIGDKTFLKLNDYVDDFVNFLETNYSFFRFEKNEERYVVDVLLSFVVSIINDKKKKTEEKEKEIGKRITRKERIEIEKAVCTEYSNFVFGLEKIEYYDFSSYVSKRYKKQFKEMLSSIDLFTKDNQKIILNSVVELFNRTYEDSGYIGIAIAGYGDEEIYPSARRLKFSGVINNKVRYWKLKDAEVNEDSQSSIIPLAQTDVMNTFLLGIDDHIISDLSREIPKNIEESMKEIKDDCIVKGCVDKVSESLDEASKKIVDHIIKLVNDEYLIPMKKSISTLPIEELALLAESMINITSIRRKVVIDGNVGTVGGPIDVAIITKGDGFIWIKRKHYFEKKYNPQYYYSHFNNKLELKND